MDYPLGMTNIAGWKDPLCLMEKSVISMVIFYSYVELPEGRWCHPNQNKGRKLQLCEISEAPEVYPLVIKHGWRIPELNGGF